MMNKPKKIPINNFIKQFSSLFPDFSNLLPWEITNNLAIILNDHLLQSGPDFEIQNGIAIHKTAIIEQGAVLKAPVIIGKNCFVGSNTYLRGGSIWISQLGSS